MSNKSSGSGGGSGCFLVPLAAIAIVVGGIAFVMGADPREATETGLKWGTGLVCGLPAVIMTGSLMLWAGMSGLVFLQDTIGGRRRKRWEDI